jgi:hypothetical protein
VYNQLVARTGISIEKLIDDQNSWINDAEFNTKRAPYATKEENLTNDSDSLFAQMTK